MGFSRLSLPQIIIVRSIRRHYESYEDVINHSQYQDYLDDSQYNEDVFYTQDNEEGYIFPKDGKINDSHKDDAQRVDSHGGYGDADITNVDADDYSQEDGGDDEITGDEQSCNLDETHLYRAKSHGDSRQHGGTDVIQEKVQKNVFQENDNANIIQYDAIVNFSQEDDDVRVTQEDEIISLSQEDDSVKVTEEYDNVSISQEYDSVNVTEEDDNVSLCEEEDNVSLSKEDDSVNVTEEDENVSLSQEEDNVSLSQEKDNVSLNQEDDSVNVTQEDDATNGIQEGDDLDVCQDEEQSLFYGSYETQVSEGGEADLLKHLVSCEKNPGHKEFVPPGDFNITHLPEGYRDHDLVGQIRTTAELTVKIEVKMTSADRPEFWPNTQKPFPFYDRRGSDVMRTGTGIVHRVRRFSDDDFKDFRLGVCNCLKCQGRATPNLVCGYVWVSTGLQVVFDDVEARHASCRLFYDRPSSPVVLLGGWKMVKSSVEEDRCGLIAVTCDIELLDTLEKMLGHMQDMNKKVNDKCEFPRTEDKWVFIVSHPHGGPKQVSVGQRTNTQLVKDDLLYKKTRYMYRACTCPGSSGAYVLPFGYWGELFHNRHLHSGVNSEGTNFSGTGWE